MSYNREYRKFARGMSPRTYSAAKKRLSYHSKRHDKRYDKWWSKKYS